jgi:hypothetical protein
MGAFRIAEGAEVLEAQTHQGVLRLEVAPRHVVLALRALQVAITEEFVTVTEQLRKKVRRTSERLAGTLVVARDVPHEDLGLWLQVGPQAMRRIFGADPRHLIADDGLAALRTLDKLSARLRQVLDPYARGVRRAHEVGRGLDKVLVLDYGDRMVVYARRLFRDSARRVIELHAGGKVRVPGRHGDQEFAIRERYGFTVTGDVIRCIDRQGTDLGRVALPWIDPEDRQELARRFGEMVERRPVL